MTKRAAKLREARRLERLFQRSDRIVEFRSGGSSYVFLRTESGETMVMLNGRMLAKPPKGVLKFARQRMLEEDVDEVHGL